MKPCLLDFLATKNPSNTLITIIVLKAGLPLGMKYTSSPHHHPE
jgi:hypothetical protein